MNDRKLEQEIQSKGLNAPRVTLAQLDANIADTEIVKHVSRTGQVLRWAILTTQNGFAVVGKPSVSVSPENDNAEIGEKVAIDNSRNELWPLMGYALKEYLRNTQAWACSDCCQSFPNGIPAVCPNKAPGCDELLAQGK